MQKMITSVLFLLFMGIISCVHITDLKGPTVIETGSELLLDCDFDYLEEEESQLDLKWYFNRSPIPVYQWVPSMNKGPQVIGDLFKNSLDLEYEAHNDTFKKHRALRIINTDHRFSGTYQCKVSSFVDEDFMQKEILVYVPPKSIRIEPSISETDTQYLNVSCHVEGVYPVPIVDLSWTKNSTSNQMDKMDTLVKTGQDGLLYVTVSYLCPREDITPDVVFGCEVTFADTQFYVREELQVFQYQRLKSRYTSSSTSIAVSLVTFIPMITIYVISRTLLFI